MITYANVNLRNWGYMPLSAWAAHNLQALKGESHQFQMPIYTGDLSMIQVGNDFHVDMGNQCYVIPLEYLFSEWVDKVQIENGYFQSLGLKSILEWGNNVCLEKTKEYIIQNAKAVYPRLFSSYGNKRIYPQRVGNQLMFATIDGYVPRKGKPKIIAGYRTVKSNGNILMAVMEEVEDTDFFKKYINFDLLRPDPIYRMLNDLHPADIPFNGTERDFQLPVKGVPTLYVMDNKGKILNKQKLSSICFPSVAYHSHIHCYEADLAYRLYPDGILLLPYHYYLDFSSNRLVHVGHNMKQSDQLENNSLPLSRLWLNQSDKQWINGYCLDGYTGIHVYGKDLFVTLKTFPSQVGLISLWSNKENNEFVIKEQPEKQNFQLKGKFLFCANNEQSKSRAMIEVMNVIQKKLEIFL